MTTDRFNNFINLIINNENNDINYLFSNIYYLDFVRKNTIINKNNMSDNEKIIIGIQLSIIAYNNMIQIIDKCINNIYELNILTKSYITNIDYEISKIKIESIDRTYEWFIQNRENYNTFNINNSIVFKNSLILFINNINNNELNDLTINLNEFKIFFDISYNDNISYDKIKNFPYNDTSFKLLKKFNISKYNNENKQKQLIYFLYYQLLNFKSHIKYKLNYLNKFLLTIINNQINIINKDLNNYDIVLSYKYYLLFLNNYSYLNIMSSLQEMSYDLSKKYRINFIINKLDKINTDNNYNFDFNIVYNDFF